MFFFFNETATTEIYPLPLHDALPIWVPQRRRSSRRRSSGRTRHPASRPPRRSQAANVAAAVKPDAEYGLTTEDRKSTRLNSSHANISYAGFCLKKKKNSIDRLHINH